MTRSLGRVGQMNAAVLMLDAAAEITRLRESLRQKEASASIEYAGDAIDAVQRLLERGKATVDSDGYLCLIDPLIPQEKPHE